MAKATSTFSISVQQGRLVFPNHPGVYAIRNEASDRRYVGSAANIYARWRGHRSDLRGNKHCNQHLQRSWNKHGEASFVFEVLEKCERDAGVLMAREEHWMMEFKGSLYNMSEHANVRLGQRCSDSHKAALSARMKGNRHGAGKSVGRKLSWDDVVAIVTRYGSGDRCEDIASSFGVSENQIQRIVSRKTRFHVPLPPDVDAARKVRRISPYPRGENNHAAKLTNNDVRDVRFLLSFGVKRCLIAKRFGVSAVRISQISKGKRSAD
jgi:hypothetical protein